MSLMYSLRYGVDVADLGGGLSADAAGVLDADGVREIAGDLRLVGSVAVAPA